MKTFPIFNTKTFILLLLLVLHAGLFVWLKRVDQDDNVSSGIETENVAKVNNLENVGDSLRDAPAGSDLDLELKKFYQAQEMFCDNKDGKYDTLVKTLDNYIQRYISLFLITSNLDEYQINDLEDMISIDLEIKISGKDLAFLQEYTKSEKKLTYPRNLSKIDAIFSNIARLKQRTFMEKTLNYSWSFLSNFTFYMLNNPNSQCYLLFLIIFTVISFTYYFTIKKPYICFGIILNSMIIWDSFNLYWKKLKEMNVDIYVDMLRMNKVPEDCDPSNIKWYQTLFKFVFPDNCRQYYQNKYKNPTEEVSLLKCIVETYSYYFVQTPARILGASIRDFAGEISELWPWPLTYFINVPFVFFFSVVALFFVLLLCGKRLRLGFLGATVELGDFNPSTGNEKTAINSGSAPKAIRSIRKLRPWTKARFNRRPELVIGERRKLFLQAFTSFSDEPDSLKKIVGSSGGAQNPPESDGALSVSCSDAEPNDKIKGD